MAEAKLFQDSDIKMIAQEPIETLYIDGYMGVQFNGSVIKINLFEDKADPVTQTLNRHIVKRLVMPLNTFIAIRDAITNSMEELGINAKVDGN